MSILRYWGEKTRSQSSLVAEFRSSRLATRRSRSKRETYSRKRSYANVFFSRREYFVLLNVQSSFRWRCLQPEVQKIPDYAIILRNSEIICMRHRSYNRNSTKSWFKSRFDRYLRKNRAISDVAISVNCILRRRHVNSNWPLKLRQPFKTKTLVIWLELTLEI